MRASLSRLTAAASVLAMVAALAACAAEADGSPPPEPGSAEPSTAPQETTEPAPTDPSPSPTPDDGEPAEDPDDPSTWHVTTDRVGPVELGMPMADVAELFGTEVTADERPGSACTSVDGGEGADGDPIVSAHAEDGVVQSIFVRSVDTDNLDTVGDVTSEADLMELLGEPRYEAWGPGGSPAWVVESEDSAVLAIGDSFTDEAPIRFIVTAFSYADDGGETVWFPVCFD